MDATPGDIGVTMPVTGLIVEIAGVLLVHVPPGVASVSDTVVDTQAVTGPVIGAGRELTVKSVVTNPDPVVYVIMATPAPTPFTIPEEDPTVAIPGAELLQVPPDVVSLRVVELPLHKFVAPMIGPTCPFEQKKDSSKLTRVRYFMIFLLNGTQQFHLLSNCCPARLIYMACFSQ